MEFNALGFFATPIFFLGIILLNASCRVVKKGLGSKNLALGFGAMALAALAIYLYVQFCAYLYAV